MTLPPILLGYLDKAGELALLALGFFILAWITKGARSLTDARAATTETKNNALLFVIETLTVAPYMTMAFVAVHTYLHGADTDFAGTAFWTQLGAVPTVFLAILICDFVAYCSHRLYHTAWLWPAHAIHHSDTRLTWFSLTRQHPFERFRTLIDLIVMVLLGLPDWALITTAMVRTYWGYMIHADLPWTFGPFGFLLVSPVMHRWHHALEVPGSGVNFGIVFSVFDRLFGTYYVPGLCLGPTGVKEPIAPGLIGQYLHPFKTWGAMATEAANLSRPRVSP